jgi:hypothetical protein
MTFTGELTGKFQNHGTVVAFEINRGIEDDLLGAEKVWIAIDHRVAANIIQAFLEWTEDDLPIEIEYEAWQIFDRPGR